MKKLPSVNHLPVRLGPSRAESSFVKGFILAHSHQKADNAKVHDEIEIVRANLVEIHFARSPRT